MHRVRYCVIKSCENFNGTNDSNIRMFRTPADGETRIKWIETIGAANGNNFNGHGLVCQLHFTSSELIKTSREIKLKKGVIPSQFFVDCIEHTEEINRCANCEEIRNKIKILEESAITEKLKNQMQQLKQSELIKRLESEKQENIRSISKLKDIISGLQGKILFLEKSNQNLKKSLIKEDPSEANPSDTSVRTVDLLDCFINGVKSGVKYPETVRQFSLTLNYLSGRAYDFVRKIFNDNLPGRSTIRTWYANSDLDSTPGINLTALRALEKKSIENKRVGKELVCSMCFDEISIRQHMQWCNSSKIMLGLPTVGENLETEDTDLAKQVIVFMLNVIDEKFQIPVAYEFITSLDATSRAELLKEIILKLMNIGVLLTNVSFDGYRANAKMAKILGANFDVDSPEFKPYFYVNGRKIFIIYDNCHMLKLVRNAIGSLGTIFNEKAEKIEWSYFENLLQCGKSKGFALTHKMNRKHIEFQKNIMKVELAVQTLSSSTAKTMLFLKNKGIEEFKGVSATAYYAQTFNDLFDIFNSKNDANDEPLKKALCPENINRVSQIFKQATKYINGLYITTNNNKKQKITKSNRGTGFKGFLINMKSLELMYEEFIVETKVLSSIRTYYLNQDHLEIFFGKIRALNGFNDNPTAQQFAAAFCKLLANDSISVSKHANCKFTEMPPAQLSNILNVSSRPTRSSQNVIMPSKSELQHLFSELEKIEMKEQNDLNSNSLRNCTIAAIAKKIEKRLESLDRVYCSACENVFKREEKVSNDLVADAEAPCESTFAICMHADRFLKLHFLKGSISFKTIHFAILNDIVVDKFFLGTNFDHQPDHKVFLIREIVEIYVQIKGCYLAKTATLESHKELVRSAYHKEIHFRGQ